MGNNNETMAYSLFQFLKNGVTIKQLEESTNAAYGKKVEKVQGFKRVVKEGKLVADPSKITDPKGTIQTLAEETSLKEPVAQDKKIKTANAGITEHPEVTRIQKDMEKNNNTVAKLTQGKDGLDPDASAKLGKTKEEKKIEPKVSSVEKVKEIKDTVTTTVPEVKAEQFKKSGLEVSGLKKEKAENESKLPSDPSTITNPVVEESVNGKPQFTVWVKSIKEADETNPVGVEKKTKVVAQFDTQDAADAESKNSKYNGKATVSATKDPSTQKDTFQVTVAEAVDVTVATDDKKVAINTTPEGETTVTTSDVNATPISASPEVLEPVVPEIAPTEDVPAVEETPAEEDEDTLMAEKIYVSDLLKGKPSLTEKEQAFVKAVDGVVLSEAKKAKVAKKVLALKDKKVNEINIHRSNFRVQWPDAEGKFQVQNCGTWGEAKNLQKKLRDEGNKYASAVYDEEGIEESKVKK